MFWLVYVADQVGLNLTLSETPKFGFLTSWPIYIYVCMVWCSLLLIYVCSLCLRAPRKIGSSIGLPSLNKVVTYLLNLVFDARVMQT